MDSLSQNLEHFTINSEKAAEILGVNRTRLSQLTSQGLFPYERRKVEARSRLFYRLNDLLSYQRKSSFGNLSQEHTLKVNAIVPLLPPASSHQEMVQNNSLSSQIQPVKAKSLLFKQNAFPKEKRTFKSALEIKQTNLTKLRFEHLSQKVQDLEIEVSKILYHVGHVINLLNNQKDVKLTIKKTMFRRPRTKSQFKIIK